MQLGKNSGTQKESIKEPKSWNQNNSYLRGLIKWICVYPGKEGRKGNDGRENGGQGRKLWIALRSWGV